jgi:hypothetical protein
MLEYQIMNPTHPYLNPQENPATALYRLINLLPNTLPFITNQDTAQLALAISHQARRVSQILNAGINILLPLIAPSQNTPPHANLFTLINQLMAEAETALTAAEVHQSLVACFYQRHPHLEPATITPQFDTPTLMAQFNKHYYFPLCKLLQQLPGDITNQPHLTPEQGNMCIATSQFAERAYVTLTTGLSALAMLMNPNPSEPAPNLYPLMDYLQAEAQFMHECSADYRDAAMNIARKV